MTLRFATLAITPICLTLLAGCSHPAPLLDRYATAWYARVAAAASGWTATRLPTDDPALPELYRVNKGAECPSIVAAVIAYDAKDPGEAPAAGEAIQKAALEAAQFNADSASILKTDANGGTLELTGVCGNGSAHGSAQLSVKLVRTVDSGRSEALYTLVTGDRAAPSAEALALRDALVASWSAARR